MILSDAEEISPTGKRDFAKAPPDDAARGRDMSAHRARVRSQILQNAPRVFARLGFEAAGLDELMAAAGKTRGAFYGHFASKDALFIEVLRHPGPLCRALQARRNSGADALWRDARHIFAAYLDPFDDSFRSTCPLASLAWDALRHSDAASDALRQARAQLEAELIRGQPIQVSDPDISAALTLAIGAAQTSALTGSDGERDATLSSAATVFSRLTSAARFRARMDARAARESPRPGAEEAPETN